MTVIIVRLGDLPGNERIFDYIDSVFNADIERMQKYSDVEWPETLREEAGAVLTIVQRPPSRRPRKKGKNNLFGKAVPHMKVRRQSSKRTY